MFRRTIDAVVIGYAKQTLSFFLVDLDLIMDVVSLFKNQLTPELLNETDLIKLLITSCGLCGGLS
jgi:uncharacterized membrane protein